MLSVATSLEEDVAHLTSSERPLRETFDKNRNIKIILGILFVYQTFFGQVSPYLLLINSPTTNSCVPRLAVLIAVWVKS